MFETSFNQRTVGVKLRRIELLDAIVAIDAVIADFESEIKNPETTQTRRGICQSSIDKRWKPLREKLVQQLDAYDARFERNNAEGRGNPPSEHSKPIRREVK